VNGRPVKSRDAREHLMSLDPSLADFIVRQKEPEARPPEGDPFAALAKAIVSQQVAIGAAAAIHRRVLATVGGAMTAASVLATPSESLRTAGLSAAKAASLLDLATKSLDGSLALEGLSRLDDDEVISRLVTVRGIGRWTAQMFLLFELERADVWPTDDLAVRAGWSLIHGLPRAIDARALSVKGEPFRPHRSLVARYCWHAVRLRRAGELVDGTADC
jgi:DNA-3-methyladenine glycosylase II